MQISVSLPSKHRPSLPEFGALVTAWCSLCRDLGNATTAQHKLGAKSALQRPSGRINIQHRLDRNYVFSFVYFMLWT